MGEYGETMENDGKLRWQKYRQHRRQLWICSEQLTGHKAIFKHVERWLISWSCPMLPLLSGLMIPAPFKGSTPPTASNTNLYIISIAFYCVV